MDWIQGVFRYIERAWHWIRCFFPNLWCQGADFLVSMLGEIMLAATMVMSVIPVPDALTNFQWPDAGPFGYALIELGIPQGLAILSAAFMVRFLRGLIPMIRS